VGEASYAGHWRAGQSGGHKPDHGGVLAKSCRVTNLNHTSPHSHAGLTSPDLSRYD
ncbi:hypothetical protein H8957_016309, partial [Semnopithecus entellus]